MSSSISAMMCVLPVMVLLVIQAPSLTEAHDASDVTGLSESDQMELLYIHNALRANVTPNATNMERMIWSTQLASIAQQYANLCMYQFNENRNMQAQESTPFTYIGENIGFSTSFIVDYTAFVEFWFRAGENYDFDLAWCHPYCDCNPYLQIIWATTCSVGCGVAYCDPLQGYPGGAALFLVCNYGPAFDPNSDMTPYMTGGDECSACPPIKTNCDENGLCYSPNDQMMCMGADPHFSVSLPSGHTLCYTVQGEHNSYFNLYSSNKLRINARFIPDDVSNNTWLGVVGVIIMDGDNKTTQLMFEATNQAIHLGDDVMLPASSVDKLVFKEGRLVVVNTPRRLSLISPKVHIDIRDSHLNFTISFVKNQHLDLLWHSTGQDKNMHGIIGQFFRSGVQIDEEQKMLVFPERAPVPVKQRPVWAFMKTEVPTDHMCWTSITPSNQGEGVIEGKYLDYKVNDIYSTEFKLL